jgi:quinol---cytochrome c reductase iron-sulfur subunit, bacillus type
MSEVTRRGFFGGAIAAIAGLIGLGVLVPAGGYTILPAFKKTEEAWSEAGTLDKLAVNHPKELEIIQTSASGWMKANTVRSVWGFRKPEGEIVVYSPLCTHLGCGYTWDEEKNNFHCPCHNSIYDLDGKVLSGPAPRALDRLPTKTDGDRLFIQYKEYKAGISKEEEI